MGSAVLNSTTFAHFASVPFLGHAGSSLLSRQLASPNQIVRHHMVLVRIIGRRLIGFLVERNDSLSMPLADALSDLRGHNVVLTFATNDTQLATHQFLAAIGFYADAPYLFAIDEIEVVVGIELRQSML